MNVKTVSHLVSLLLLHSAAMFAFGVALERSRPGEVRSDAGAQVTEAQGGASEAADHDSNAAVEGSAGENHSESGETLLGINPESNGLVVAAILASVALALALWIVGGSSLLLGAAALVGLAAAAFDLREAVHQADLSDSALVAVAVAVAVVHLAVTAASAVGVGLARRAAGTG